YFDTWEFDGTNWKEVIGNGPQLYKPVLAYDAGRKQTVMIGWDSSSKTHFYTYDPDGPSWNEVTAAASLPACASEPVMTYEASNDRIVFQGGQCTDSTDLIGDTWVWNG